MASFAWISAVGSPPVLMMGQCLILCPCSAVFMYVYRYLCVYIDKYVNTYIHHQFAHLSVDGRLGSSQFVANLNRRDRNIHSLFVDTSFHFPWVNTYPQDW